jgi:alpha-galactosidase
MNIKCLTSLALWFSASLALGQSWTIGNDRIERAVRFDETAGLTTERISDLVSHKEYVHTPRGDEKKPAEFSMVVNGAPQTGASFAFVKAEQHAIENGKSLEVQLRSKTLPLMVTVVYSVYDGQSSLRKWLILRNTGTAPLRITHLTIEAVGPSVGASNETLLDAQYGTIPRETFYTGRSEDAGLFLSNARTGDGFAVLTEVPGYMKRTEINAWYDNGRVDVGVMYDTDLMPFARTLAPGEEFKTAGASLLTYRNGDGFHDPRWVVPSYTSGVLQRKTISRGAPWIYNTWEPFERNINEATTLELVKIAGTMGMDIFTIDDGWQKEYGENVVDEKAFPHGLDGIRKEVEARGMRLGLWIPLAAIGLNTPDYEQHPEWAALDQAGKPKLTSTMGGSKVVMCLATPFQDSAAARINDAIERFHLAYVKLDLTTIFNAYGEAPGCWAKGHFHGDWSESLNEIYEGISKVTSKVYAQHPDVLLDLTFELWGQKHVIDAGLLAAGDMDWMSNVRDGHPDAAGPIQVRTLLYQRAPSMPVESMLIGNLHAGLPNAPEVFATVIGSAPLLLGDLRELSPQDQQWYHDHIRWFKELRARTAINQSFFSLGNWQQPSVAGWDGFARLSRDGSGVIALFRNQSGVPAVKVALPLMPEGRFKLHSVMTNRDLGEFSREDLSRGVEVSFPGSQKVEILEVQSRK